MIRFMCPTLRVDRLSWVPSADGLVIQLWHSERPTDHATILASVDDLKKLLALCQASGGETCFTQNVGYGFDPPLVGEIGGGL